MIYQSFIYIFQIHILIFAYAEHSHATKPLNLLKNLKREVELEVFDDIKQVTEDKDEDDVINVCRNENSTVAYLFILI